MNFANIQALERRLAFSVELLADINPAVGTGSNPSWLIDSGGMIYAAVDDGSHGSELYLSNGTTVGTSLLKDINPNAASSTPQWTTDLNGTLYFTANDGVNGIELWKSNGTPQSTAMVADINPAGSSTPQWLIAINGVLYFTADDGVNGIELWKYDGTASMVKNIRTAGASSPQDLFNLNGTLCFSAIDDTTGRELWMSDGTSANTYRVKDINTFLSGGSTLSSFPGNFVNYNGELYFQAIDTSANGRELWRTNGTAAGTVMVANIAASGSSSPFGFCVYNNALYFEAEGTTSDAELWVTDGTTTTRVKDIYSGTTGSYPSNLFVFNNALYFTATNSTQGKELWKSDGTAAGTVIVKDIRTGFGSSSNPDWMRVLNGSIYFTADNGSTGKELWRTDGSDAGTVLVRDIYPGSTTSAPLLLRAVGNALYFFATNSTHGSELWKLSLPSALSSAFNVDQPAIQVAFDQDVTISNVLSNYVIQLVGGIDTYFPSSMTYNAGTKTATFAVPTTLPDGNYRLTVPKSAATDSWGNPLSANVTSDFYILAGDANRDRIVDTQDFNRLAANFGGSSKVFSQGNFDYDGGGNVNSADFNIMVGKFGKRLPAAAGLAIVNPPLFSVNDGSDDFEGTGQGLDLTV